MATVDVMGAQGIQAGDAQNKVKPGKTLKYFSVVAGNTLNSDVEFKKHLQKEVSCLEEVSSEGECDVILLFCPVSRAGTDIEAALVKLHDVSESKPAVVVVLHHNISPEIIIPNSRETVTRPNTLTVDCVFNEDRGLLTCSRNREALKHIEQWINIEGLMAHTPLNDISSSKDNVQNPELHSGPQNPVVSNEQKKKTKRTDSPTQPTPETGNFKRRKGKTLKYFTVVAGNTLNSDVEFKKRLQEEVPCLEEVFRERECDLILLFCPVVSRAGTDIDAALVKLCDVSESKPVVVVVLYHTISPEITVPNSRETVTRPNTLTVDCVFNEDRGLLTCSRNREALKHIEQWINIEGLMPLTPLNDISSSKDNVQNPDSGPQNPVVSDEKNDSQKSTKDSKTLCSCCCLL
ncbi:uncharacterized protein [Hoplias malabaricus]|uniref:uncharacterized protein n=1 Tax=Hoplias malabaricus TaxID=27720 RepID=UPI003461AA78